MGTWGTSLYDDDTAADVRDGWRERVAAGEDGEAVTRALLEEWSASLDDPHVANAFWFALADTQWRAGRLEERVKAEALRALHTDLELWDPEDRGRRRRTLAALRATLAKPPPKPKRIRVTVDVPQQTDLRPGQVLAWQLRSGRWSMMHVAALGEYLGVVPIVRVLDWCGDAVPSELPTATSRPSRIDGWGAYLTKAGPRDRPPGPRLVVHPSELPPIPDLRGGVVFTWKFLDRHLADFYDLR